MAASKKKSVSYADVVRKALEDEKFRNLAQKDPRAALRSMGHEPTDAQVALAESFPWHHVAALHHAFAVHSDVT